MLRIMLIFMLSITSSMVNAKTWNFSINDMKLVKSCDGWVTCDTEVTNDYTLTGSFTAEDENNDGSIAASELSSMTFSWISPAHIFLSEDDYNSGFNGDGAYVDRFNYSPSTGLDLRLMGWYIGFDTTFGLRSGGKGISTYGYYDDNTYTKVSSPVPEPSTYALLISGLLLMAYVRNKQISGKNKQLSLLTA